MTAIRGYECDRCKTVVAVDWRTLRFHYGWTMVANTPRHPTGPTLHYCGPCSEAARPAGAE